jgi:SAM-dependent methyltransferase
MAGRSVTRSGQPHSLQGGVQPGRCVTKINSRSTGTADIASSYTSPLARSIQCRSSSKRRVGVRLQKVAVTLHGVDLAPGMLATALAAVSEAHLKNIELLEAPAEQLPLPDGNVDGVMANGLFNLVPDKALVAREVARILRR